MARVQRIALMPTGVDHGVDDDVRTVLEDAEYAMDASFRIGDIDGTYFGRYRQGFE